MSAHIHKHIHRKSLSCVSKQTNECLICDICIYLYTHRKWYMCHMYTLLVHTHTHSYRIYVKPHTNRSQIKPCVYFFLYHNVQIWCGCWPLVRFAFLHNHSWVDAHINAIFFSLSFFTFHLAAVNSFPLFSFVLVASNWNNK